MDVIRLRMIAYLIDRLILIVMYAYYKSFIIDYLITISDIKIDLYIIVYTIFAVIYFFYFFIFEYIFHASFASLFLGLKVIREDYEKPSTKKILIRNLCRFIPFDTFLMFFLDKCLRDIITKTTIGINYSLTDKEIKINDSITATLPARSQLFWTYLLDRVILGFWFVIFIGILNLIFLENKSVFTVNLVYAISFSVLYFLYFFIQELEFNSTIAKQTIKAYLINNDGEKPTRKQILIRTLGRFIPFDTLSYFVKRLGIHDKISKTLLVTKLKVKNEN